MVGLINKALLTLMLMMSTGQTIWAETLKISGRLIVAGCMVETIPTVKLGDKISVAQLSSLGNGSDAVNYQLQLTHCPAATTRVTATLSGESDILNINLFKNSIGSDFAKGVGIEVKDMDNGGIILANGSSMTAMVNESMPTNRTVTFNMSSRLVSSKQPVTAGKVQASITIGFIYR